MLLVEKISAFLILVTVFCLSGCSTKETQDSAQPINRTVAAVRSTTSPQSIASPADFMDLASLLRSAEQEFNNGRLNSAEDLFLKALDMQPGNRAALLRLAEISRRQGAFSKAISFLRTALTQDSRDFEVLFLMGRAHLESGDAKEALVWLRRAREENPKNPDARLFLGLAAHKLGRPDLAAREWESSISAGVTSPALHYHIGVYYFDNGIDAQARANFNQALRLDNSFSEAHNGLAGLALREGNLAAAIEQWEKAASLKSTKSSAEQQGAFLDSSMPQTLTPGRDFEIIIGPHQGFNKSRLGEAFELLNSKRFDEAISILRSLSRSERQNEALHLALGSALANTGQFQEAVLSWQRAVEINDSNFLSHNNLGAVLIHLGDYPGAERHLLRALSIKESPETYFNLGTLHAATDRGITARRYYQSAIRLNPDYARAHNDLAVLLEKSGEINEAISHYQSAASKDSSLYKPLFNLGLLNIKNKDYQEAEKNLKKALAINPGIKGAWVNLGYAQALQRKYDEALSSWQKSLSSDSNAHVAHNNIGVYHLIMGEYDRATQEFSKALKSDGSFAEAYLNNAAARFRAGDNEGAILAYENFLRLSPGHLKARQNVAQLLIREKRPEEALAHLKTVVSLEIGDLDSLFNMGVCYQMLGQNREAVIIYREFLTRAQDRAEYYESAIQAERAIAILSM